MNLKQKEKIFHIGTDTCELNFDEILKKYFAGCSSSLQFRHACFETLKNEYHSAYGFDVEAAKAHLAEENEKIEEDKVYTMDIPKWKMAYAEYIRDRQKKVLSSTTYQRWTDWCYDRLMEQHQGNTSFKVGDRVKINYIGDANPHNGEVGTIIRLHSYKSFPEGNINAPEDRVQATIKYDDGWRYDIANLYRKESGLISPVIKVD